MKKTLSERLLDETLSDNSKIIYCKQCEKCNFRDNGDVWSNHFSKLSCMIYRHPNIKPKHVINNTGRCEYLSEE